MTIYYFIAVKYFNLIFCLQESIFYNIPYKVSFKLYNDILFYF